MEEVIHKKKRRKRKSSEFGYEDPELNIMPFIDVFGLLTTYLLFSAVFVSVGIHEVQVPFLTNAPPPKGQPARSISLNLDVEKEKLILKTTWSPPPENEKTYEYPHNDEGAKQLHEQLVQLRTQHPETDLVTLFSDDEVTWEELNKILDAVKLRWEGDPAFPNKDGPDDVTNLYNKVVMGSVIL